MALPRDFEGLLRVGVTQIKLQLTVHRRRTPPPTFSPYEPLRSVLKQPEVKKLRKAFNKARNLNLEPRVPKGVLNVDKFIE